MQANSTWLKGQTKRQLFFPVPIETGRERFKAAFSTTFKESQRLLHASNKYEAHITANKIYLKYTTYDKFTTTFKMVGEIFIHSQGTRIEITVRNSAWGLITLTTGFLAILLYTGFPLAIVFAILDYSAMAWNRSIAADSISLLLKGIISNTNFDL